MRADAQRNLERIREAAAQAFAELGFDAPLETIAARAGVSVGTIYNRFGGRDGLIDAVIADLAAQRLDTAIAAVAGDTAWERFSSYVRALAQTQADDPAFNAVFGRRYPEAVELQATNDRAVAHGETLVRAAQQDGTVRSDFTAEDLGRLIWLNAQAVRLGDDWWRRALEIFLDGLRQR